MAKSIDPKLYKASVVQVANLLDCSMREAGIVIEILIDRGMGGKRLSTIPVEVMKQALIDWRG